MSGDGDRGAAEGAPVVTTLREDEGVGGSERVGLGFFNPGRAGPWAGWLLLGLQRWQVFSFSFFSGFSQLQKLRRTNSKKNLNKNKGNG